MFFLSGKVGDIWQTLEKDSTPRWDTENFNGTLHSRNYSDPQSMSCLPIVCSPSIDCHVSADEKRPAALPEIATPLGEICRCSVDNTVTMSLLGRDILHTMAR